MATKYETVADYLTSLDNEQAIIAAKFRETITSQFPNLVEHIKWNACSYIHEGSDRITFNTSRPGIFRVVYHMDTSAPESKQLPPIIASYPTSFKWNSNIRATATITGISQINDELISFTKKWLSLSTKH